MYILTDQKACAKKRGKYVNSIVSGNTLLCRLPNLHLYWQPMAPIGLLRLWTVLRLLVGLSEYGYTLILWDAHIYQWHGNRP